MPSRVGLSTPRASRKVISDLRHPDQDQDHHAHAQTQTQSGGAATNQPFTSALSLRPTALRRRGSDGGSPRSARHNPNHHARSPSMDGTPSDPHPLRRSSTSAKTVRCDLGSTRPRLSRALSPSTPDLARQPDPPPPETTMPHRTVLAHEVSPTDTLAGVALKYGISVTELRRANQLWASDSIHLREVLYVPLDKARHADLETVASLLAQRADSEDTDRAPAAAAAPRPQGDTRTLDTSPIIQRIPSTSLSFFPPPSSRPSTPPSGAPFATPGSSTAPFRSHSSHSPSATISTPSRGASLSSNLRTNALSSLFSILPLNASTRDEIMSRLSIDSVSNSTTASDEAEHELTAVPTTLTSRTDAAASVSAPLATKAQRKRATTHTWRGESSGPNDDREPYPRAAEQIALGSSPIHTTQMQPAAAMRLPEYMTRGPSKGAPSNDPHSGARLPSRDDHRRTR